MPLPRISLWRALRVLWLVDLKVEAFWGRCRRLESEDERPCKRTEEQVTLNGTLADPRGAGLRTVTYVCFRSIVRRNLRGPCLLWKDKEGEGRIFGLPPQKQERVRKSRQARNI